MMANKMYRLTDPAGFAAAHSSNPNMLNFINKHSPNKLIITALFNESNDFVAWKCGNVATDAAITNRELLTFFTEINQSEFEQISVQESKKVGEMKIILTYTDGKTLEEEGVYSIDLTDNDVTYKYNRKKLGFIKYSGEISLLINELKQITITSRESTTVFHVEAGIILREHVMYDDERKFKGRRYNR